MVSRRKRFYLFLHRLTAPLGVQTVGRWLVYSILVGAVGGFGGIVFNFLYQHCNHLMMEKICHYSAPAPGGEAKSAEKISTPIRPNLWILIIPAVGGLISGFIVYRYAPEAEGHGTDAVVESFHRARGIIRSRTPIVKIIASSITIGSGGSAGREGPIAQIGAGFGSVLASLLRLSDRERRILVVAGVGAGIGSIFRAPLGGALFATEVLYRDPEFEYEGLIPAFIASIVGYSVYCPLSGTGWGAIFKLPAEGFHFSHPSTLVLYGILGPVLALFGAIYVKAFYWTRDRFRDLRIPNTFKPAIGGIGVGLLALVAPQVLGMGYGYLQQAIDGNLAIKTMLLIGIGKIVATSLTVASGGSGGVFAPSLVIGGMLGGALGMVFSNWFPGLGIHPGEFVLVGMAGFFAGAGKVPVSSMIMVSEMTVGYGLVVPLMLVVAVTYALSGGRLTIYEKQVGRRVESPAHTGDFIVDILETIPVRDVYRPETSLPIVSESTPLEDVLHLTTETTHTCFPVVNEKGEMAGVILLEDLRSAFFEPELFSLVIARDIAVKSFPVIFLDENLSSALRKLMESGSTELPVVEEKNPKVAVGLLSRHDLILAYHKRMRDFLARRDSRSA